MRTYGADPRGVRVEWRDGGGRTRLVGGTELGRMMGTDPNLALSVLDGLARWEAGKSTGGMDLQCKGWVRVHDRAGETSMQQQHQQRGEDTPPPRPQNPNPLPKGPQEKTPLRE